MPLCSRLTSQFLRANVFLFFAAIFPTSNSQAIPIAITMTYSDRAAFESQLSRFIVDDYSAAGYFAGDRIDEIFLDIHTDARMSSIVGETDYITTGFIDWNIISNQSINPKYCAGCNGSFELGFTTTSIGTANGVYGVGFDTPPASNDGNYIGFATFGDGSTQNYAMPGANGFFGLTSDLLIARIHFGLIDGGTTRMRAFSIDNLTIGVPEPATILLTSVGLAGLGVVRRRRLKA